MTIAWIFVCFLAAVRLSSANPTYPVCGNHAVSAALDAIIQDDVERLIEVESSEAIISVQLTRQDLFYTLNASVAAIIQKLNDTNKHTSVGRLAYYVLAAKASCQDPENFGGTNVVELLRRRLEKQCHHKGNHPRPPPDGWYSFGLALQAQCIHGASIDGCNLETLLQLQSINGSFGDSVDETSQMLLALKCLKEAYQDPVQSDPFQQAILKAKAFLLSKVVNERDNVYIGNKYSTSEALLALKEESNGNALGDLCNVVANSLADEATEEPDAFVASRLLALGGRSVLSLKENWTCRRAEPTPTSANPPPTSTPTTTSVSICDELLNFERDFLFAIDINVTLSVEANLSEVENSTANVLNVPKDFNLLQVMQQAKCTDIFRFKTTMTSWGPMLTEVNGVRARQHQREYWSLLNGDTGISLPVGIGQYLPSHNEHILFKLATF